MENTDLWWINHRHYRGKWYQPSLDNRGPPDIEYTDLWWINHRRYHGKVCVSEATFPKGGITVLSICIVSIAGTIIIGGGVSVLTYLIWWTLTPSYFSQLHIIYPRNRFLVSKITIIHSEIYLAFNYVAIKLFTMPFYLNIASFF